MSAVLAGMSLLQLAQLADAAAGAGVALVKLHQEFSEKEPGDRPLTEEEAQKVNKAIQSIHPAFAGVDFLKSAEPGGSG